MYKIIIAILAAVTAAVLLGMLCVSRIRLNRLKKSAYIDRLSGVLTEAGFRELAHAHVSGRADLFAVVSMCVPEIGKISQNYESEKHRGFIRYICGVLKAQLGDDKHIARTGEDVILFLIQNRHPDEIRKKLDDICDALNSFNADNEEGVLYMRPRFGIYLPEDAEEEIDELIKKSADARVSAGRNQRYNFYDIEFSEKNGHSLEIARSIPRAIRTGEFIVFFQPKVRVSDQRVVGAEALIRWRHHQRGIMSSDMFLPVAERFGMIEHIDRFVLEEVCRTLARWQKQDREPCPISVNLSEDSVNRPNFADECSDICSSCGVSPALIEFEMNEELILAEPERIKALIERLHFHGFRCAIHNFGDSVCSMQVLGSFGIDTVKLDKSFFSGENNNRQGRFLIENILKIAAQMHICTVAECIDNGSQAEYLRQAACDVIQGFYFFKPMPLEKFEDAVFDGKMLKYAEKSFSENDSKSGAAAFSKASRPSSKNIILFTYSIDEDQIEFSDIFSPVLGNDRVFEHALALFRTSDLVHENDRKDFFALFEKCQREEGWVENTLRFYMTRGRYEWLEVRMHRNGNLISGMLADMSGWKNEVNLWKEKATRDALTGLYNREYFEQNTSKILNRKNHPCAAFIFIDVDDFKRVNDTHGHMFGDDVLCFVAKQLLGVFRHTDIIARYAGDEFVVFAPSLDRSVLKDRLTKLVSTFNYPYRSGGVEYKLSVSIGASVYPDDGTDYDTLLEHADCALYEAKENGKNGFAIYEPYMKGDTSGK